MRRFELLRRLMLRCVAAALVSVVVTPPTARADIPEFMWGPVEDVDDSVETISSSSGISVQFSNDEWHVVYEKHGDILHAARADTG